MPIVKIVPMPGPQGPAGSGEGGSADIADFTFELVEDGEDTESTMTVANHDMTIRTTRTDDEDADISLNSADDIWLNAGDEIEINANSTILLRANDGIFLNDPFEPNNQIATIGDIQDLTTGDITFDGIQIIGAGTASGDGNNYGTIELVPDSTRYETDQYLIVDPTAPNHIHIRAGGTQDAATADLILGGERNNVIVSDGGRVVGVSTRPDQIINSYSNESVVSGTDFVTSSESDIQIGYTVNVGGTDYVVDTTTIIDEGVVAVTASGAVFEAETSYTFTFEPDYINQWVFAPNGVLYGPAMGAVRLASIMNADSDNIGIYANDADIFLEANAGAVSITAEDITIGSNSAPSTLSINTYSGAVINSARTSSYDPEDKVVATLGDINTAVTPVDTAFTVEGGALGTQPTFNGAPLFSGSYVKAGAMVHFRVDVDFDNILTFGTGQYYINLPFTPKYNYMFTGGCLHDSSTGITYVITGHVFAGNPQMRLESTDNSGNTSYNIPFTYNHPITLATADNFHLYGDYIIDTEAP